MLDRQTAKLIARVSENLPNMEKDVMQSWINDPKRLQAFLSGLNTTTATKPTTSGLYTIKVDRSVKPRYSEDLVKKFIYPDIQCKGPFEFEYDLEKDVVLWFYHDQDKIVVSGEVILKQLKDKNGLVNHLGLKDAMAIQEKGIAFFRKFFGGNSVFFWKSIIRDVDSDVSVPYLFENHEEVVLGWKKISANWDSQDPALMFSK